MENFILSCCSTADLSKQHFEQRDIHYICFHYSVDGKEMKDDLGQSMSFEDFYKAMANGCETKTSQVSTGEYTEFFEKFLAAGQDILHICISSGLSGTINSARAAAEILQAKYPQRQLLIVDSLGASSGYGLIMDKLADLRDQGKSITEVRDWAEENKLYMHHWFFSTDLSFYVKGGRISKAAGIFGGIMHICPLLNMDKEGHLTSREKIRGKAAVIKRIVEMMVQHAQNGLDYDGKCYISNSGCIEDAKQVAAMIEQQFPKLNGSVEINSVGTTIGSHTGPGTVALFFWGDKREN